MALARHIGDVIYVNSPGLGGSVARPKMVIAEHPLRLVLFMLAVYVSDPSPPSPVCSVHVANYSYR